jgi:LysM repeat protein
MAFKRLILLLPVLVITITACSKQASNPVEIVAEASSDGQTRPFITSTETPDPDAITVIIGTALPFDQEGVDTTDPEDIEDESTVQATMEFGVVDPISETPFATSTPLPDVIMFTATPFPSQTPQGAIDSVMMETSTPFIQATQPVITPSSPLSGDSAIHTPTARPQETDETNEPSQVLTDDEITTIVSTPSAGTTRPTLTLSDDGEETTVPTQPTASATEVPEECLHIVRRGDTVFKIALANGTTVAAIQAVNPSLTNPELISLGQRIVLPNCNATPTPEVSAGATQTSTGTLNETIHVVRSGDTLGRIARQYGVSLTLLVERNSITDPNRLSIGQEIIVPIPNN